MRRCATWHRISRPLAISLAFSPTSPQPRGKMATYQENLPSLCLSWFLSVLCPRSGFVGGSVPAVTSQVSIADPFHIWGTPRLSGSLIPGGRRGGGAQHAIT